MAKASPKNTNLPNILFPNQTGVIPALTHADGTCTPAMKSNEPVFYYPEGVEPWDPDAEVEDDALDEEIPEPLKLTEGFFIPHGLDNIELDKEFIGSTLDTSLGLNIASIDDIPLSDELFPPILDAAPITLSGLLDNFALYYPERAQLLASLVETNGFTIDWIENPIEEEQRIKAELQALDMELDQQERQQAESYDKERKRELKELRERINYLEAKRIHHSSLQLIDELERTQREYYKKRQELETAFMGDIEQLEQAQRPQRDKLNSRLDNIRHWNITDKTITLSSRINKNIDNLNWFFGIDDPDLVSYSPTNKEGAKWLNAVMGDWMVRNDMQGATSDEEFTDSFSSRIIWGSLNLVFGSIEVVSGICLVPTGSVTYGAGTVAGVALTVAGLDAFTQGIDMLSTPEQSEHTTGWLGDSVKAMATQFGYITEDDHASFDKYWSFAILGLSLGGSGIVAVLPKAAREIAFTTGRSAFHTVLKNQIMVNAKTAITGVKNAKFGKFTVSFATLPSARTIFNITGIGRFVAPVWESVTRLRLRFIADDFIEVRERARKLGRGDAGLVSIRGGIKTQADAQRLVEEAAKRMDVSAKRLSKLVSKIVIRTKPTRDGRPITSSFNPRTKVIAIRKDIGSPLDNNAFFTEYNEFRAITEAMHEVGHALEFERQIKAGKTLEEIVDNMGDVIKYNQEEVLVETAAQNYMRRIAESRIAQERRYGNADKADEFEAMLNQAIKESNEYIAKSTKQLGQK